MAGISAFDIIAELAFLEEKGVIDSAVRKKWESKTVLEGVTDEIIEQIANFKRREREVRQGKEIIASLEPETEIKQSTEPTVSEIIMELRELRVRGMADSGECKALESKIIKEGITEEVIRKINYLKNENYVTNVDLGSSKSLRPEKTKNVCKESAISIIALILGVTGLFVPYVAAIFIVPVALALGCVSIYQKKKFGKTAVVLAVLGIGGIFYTSNQIQKIMEDPFAPNVLTSTGSPVITMPEYNAVKIGMSYEKVVNIIGSSGDELSRSSAGDYTFTMYSWANKNGSNMTAMFENGKLTSKSQFGLR